MLRHWEEKGPPVYISVASYLGLIEKPKGNKVKSSTTRVSTNKVSDEENAANLEALSMSLSGTGGVM